MPFTKGQQKKCLSKYHEISLGTLNIQENIARWMLNPATHHSVLHNEPSRQVTKVDTKVTFYCKTALKSQGVSKTVASHRRQIKEALKCQWQQALWQHNAYSTDKWFGNCQKAGGKRDVICNVIFVNLRWLPLPGRFGIHCIKKQE